MSPLKIEILLHYYYSPSEWTRSPTTFLDELVTEGLLKKWKSDYHLTELGRAHVIQLTELPLPRKVFLDAHNNVIGPGIDL